MQRNRHAFWLPSGAVAYVCFAALQGRGQIAPWLALIVLPLVVAEAWRRTSAPLIAEDRTRDTARSAIRAGVWGGALWCAARSGPAGHAGFDAAANLGAAVAGVAGLVALARIPALGGLLAPQPATRSLDAAAFTALLWSIAVALPAARALLGTEVKIDPLAIDYATTTAAAASLLVLIAATLRLRLLRRLEIGVADRVASALVLSLTGLFVAVPAAALNVAPPDRIVPLSVILCSLACTWAATTAEPTRVSSALRGMLALMILGAPATTAAGLLARSAPQYAGVIVLGASCVSIAIGLSVRAVARPLGPEQSHWLDAIEAASRSALEPEPDAAIRAALVALGGTSNTPGSRAELWRNDPEQVLSVDVAGYLHVASAQAPPRLYEFAMSEPERTLRTETLRALEVRRPEARPLLAWFEARKAFSATIIVDADGPLGFILLPAGNRTAPMTLEEARGARALADRISALFAVSSALARSRERELAAVRRADEADDERQRLEHIVHHEFERRAGHAERLARRLKSSIYSPAARAALERAERLGKLDAPVTLVTPLGVDPVPWAAVLHVSSARNRGTFLIIDATSSFEHDLSVWQHPETSPLVQADGGTLVILDAAALPVPVQEHIATALSRHSSIGRSSILPPGLVISARTSLAESPAAAQLERRFARWLGEAELALPRLADRAEDLRALVLNSLARIGLQSRGEPMGIEPQALHRLMEHSWPGNELELEDTLARAADVANGPTLGAADLARIGFTVAEAALPTQAAALGASRRRAGRRAPRIR